MKRADLNAAAGYLEQFAAEICASYSLGGKGAEWPGVEGPNAERDYHDLIRLAAALRKESKK